ncbi:spidroin-2 [Patella vulgata]|uniref:spidroin-2 n=1 Tax=Patella vulgata TaxID=6465 RepID=UPI0024A97616|nr:spidroin-2 [Patella vulgata]
MAFVALTVLLAATLSSGFILPLHPILPITPFGVSSPVHNILRLRANDVAARMGLAAQAQAGVLAAAGAQQRVAAHVAANIARNAAAASDRFATNAARLSGSGAGASSTAVSSMTHSNSNKRIMLAPGQKITIPIDYRNGDIQGYQRNQAGGPGYWPDPAGPGYGPEPGYGPGSAGPGYEPGHGPGSAGPGYGPEPGYGPSSTGPGYGPEPVYGPSSSGPGYGPEPLVPGYEPGYVSDPYPHGTLRSPMPNSGATGSSQQASYTDPGSPAPVGPVATQYNNQAGTSSNTVGQNTVTLGAGPAYQPQANIATNQIVGLQPPAYIPQNPNTIATAQSTQQQTVAQQTNAIVNDPRPTTYINPLPGRVTSIQDPFAANNGGSNAQIVTVNMVDPGVGNSITTGTTTNFQPMPNSNSGPGYVDPSTSAGPGISSYIGSMNAAGASGTYVDPVATLSAGAGTTSYAGSQNNAASGGAYVDPAAGAGIGYVDPVTLTAGNGGAYVDPAVGAGTGYVDPVTLTAGNGKFYIYL